MSDKHNRPGLLSRKLVINKEVQIPLLIYSMLMMGVGVLFSTVLSSASVAYYESGSPWKVVAVVFVVAIFVFFMMTYVGILLTHKIVGPMFRLREHMKRVNSNQDPGPLNLRDGDYIDPDLVKEYQAILEKIK